MALGQRAGKGHDVAQMMETAGKAVADAIIERTSVAGLSVLVLVGPGNNGGNGLVAGRHLKMMDYIVDLVVFKKL